MKKSSLILRYIVLGTIAVIILMSLTFRTLGPDQYEQGVEFLSRHLIFGNGKLVDKLIPVHDIKTVNITGKFDITITDGKQPDVVLTTDENIIPKIGITITNSNLIIRSPDEVSTRPKIVIPDAHIQEITIAGKNTLRADNLLANHVSIKMSGKNRSYIQGNVKNIEFNFSGKTELHMNLPHADSITINVSGKSRLYLTGATKNLVIIAQGKTDIIADDLLADAVVIQSMGKSSMQVHPIKSLNVQASGKSTIQYSGDPLITKNILGTSTLTKSDDNNK